MSYPEVLEIEWLKEKYATKELTPEEVVVEIIERSERDKNMNIWITPPAMEWIQPFLERLALLDPKESLLWGIPFAIKDNIDVAGVPTTAGCSEYEYIPSENAAIIGRLLAAGAIPVGKANLDQFATGLVGTRSPYGETHNALRPELISGGSSSGSAVSVARGQAVFSLGTDTAGSGRVPAALNRLVGYKPTVGAWPSKGVVPACASLDCVTVFANSLDDALAVDSVVRGLEPSDPWSKDIGQPAFELPEKIILPKEPLNFYGPFATEYKKAWERSFEFVKASGIPVESVDTELFKTAASILYDGPWVAERWAALGEFIETNPNTAFPVTEKILRSGASAGYDAASVFQAIHKLQTLKQQAKQLLNNAVLIMPTAGGTWTREQVRQDPVQTNSDMGRYTNHCNLLDLCAVSIPAGDAAVNTPFGITLFALADKEGYIAETAKRFMAIQKNETTLVAVCGLHMRGFPLEKQMKECGAVFVKETKSAPLYQLVKLPTTPAKPGMIKNPDKAGAIELEIWEMPLDKFGIFTALIPSPLGIGKVELEDGTEVPGFICEGYAGASAEDITHFGGWRKAMEEKQLIQ